MKALIEERGGVLLEKAVGLDAEHVIRFFEKQHRSNEHVVKLFEGRVSAIFL